MGSRSRLITGGLGLLLVLAGGATFVTGVIHLPMNCEGPSPNWDNPFGDRGTQVPEVNEAAPYLAFTPVVPRSLGSASRILIDGNKPDRSTKTLLLVYQQPGYGRFWVKESVAEVTQAWIESQTNNPTGCSEDSVVTLLGGTRGALAVGRVTSIMWLDHGLLMTVLGQSFTKDRAIEIANQV
jgi:hypothetical protein